MEHALCIKAASSTALGMAVTMTTCQHLPLRPRRKLHSLQYRCGLAFSPCSIIAHT
jgi:hypothetical protein